MAEHKTAGQKLIDRIVTYITRYVTLPNNLPVEAEGQALVLALWAVHTWLYERFPATPYLTITAATKQAGKTLCMEVLALICRNTHLAATLRPLALVRVMQAFEGRVTLGIDEAEKLSGGAVGDLRSIFTTGYTSGGKHIISSGKEFVSFRTFAPKMFALIGDVMDVVRDRSIVIHLQRLEPKADFRGNRTEAEAEAAQIQAGILGYFTEVPPLVQPMFLKGREREIWGPLFSVAHAMKLDTATMERLERAAADLVGLKGQDLRKFSRSQESEEQAANTTAGEQALRDLAAIFKDGEKGKGTGVFSAVAVERMKGIATSPWRTFRGVGLTEDALAGLLKPFGVQPTRVRDKAGKGASQSVQRRGYSWTNVRASLPSQQPASESEAE